MRFLRVFSALALLLAKSTLSCDCGTQTETVVSALASHRNAIVVTLEEELSLTAPELDPFPAGSPSRLFKAYLFKLFHSCDQLEENMNILVSTAHGDCGADVNPRTSYLLFGRSSETVMLDGSVQHVLLIDRCAPNKPIEQITVEESDSLQGAPTKKCSTTPVPLPHTSLATDFPQPAPEQVPVPSPVKPSEKPHIAPYPEQVQKYAKPTSNPISETYPEQSSIPDYSKPTELPDATPNSAPMGYTNSQAHPYVTPIIGSNPHPFLDVSYPETGYQDHHSPGANGGYDQSVRCTYSIECGYGSECIEGHCHYAPKGAKDPDTCIFNYECGGGNAVCLGGVCHKNGYEYPKCYYDVDCDYGFVCLDGFCQKDEAYTTQSYREKGGYDKTCRSTDECDDRSTCVGGLCVPDYHSSTPKSTHYDNGYHRRATHSQSYEPPVHRYSFRSHPQSQDEQTYRPTYEDYGESPYGTNTNGVSTFSRERDDRGYERMGPMYPAIPYTGSEVANGPYPALDFGDHDYHSNDGSRCRYRLDCDQGMDCIESKCRPERQTFVRGNNHEFKAHSGPLDVAYPSTNGLRYSFDNKVCGRDGECGYDRGYCASGMCLAHGQCTTSDDCYNPSNYLGPGVRGLAERLCVGGLCEKHQCTVTQCGPKSPCETYRCGDYYESCVVDYCGSECVARFFNRPGEPVCQYR